MPHWTTAEPLDLLDKNRLRILLPTLGFVSAIKVENMGIMNEGSFKFLMG